MQLRISKSDTRITVLYSVAYRVNQKTGVYEEC